jgi:Luciferase-like monooxygenase
VASQVATLDQLSGGRAILAVGVGATDTGLPSTGEVTDLHGRAERLDEGIDLIREPWARGNDFRGQHYVYQTGRMDLGRVTGPVQERIPIWVVGVWPRAKSMRQVLRCDGIIPEYDLDGPEHKPSDARDVRDWLIDHGARAGMDVICEGETPAGDPAAAVAAVTPCAEAGCTWWLETRWQMPHDADERMDQVRARLAAGPPGG